MKRFRTHPILAPAVLALVLLAPGRAWGAPDELPEALLAGCPDPSVVETADPRAFTVFCTGRGVPIWRSDDLLHWRRVGRVFPQDVPPWAQQAVPKARGLWAPDVRRLGGLYHLYYSVSSFGSQRSVIGLAVNRTLDPDHPDYRWEDRGLVIESAPGRTDFNAIDAALFVDRDGSPYLFWGSFWAGIKATRLDAATGKPLGPTPEIVPVAGRAPGVNPPAIEAAFVIRRGPFYYLFVSWDSCIGGLESTYKVMVGRSRNVLGPYTDARGRPMTAGGATLVVASSERWRGTGHNSVLEREAGDWLFHHAFDARNLRRGRVLQVRPLYWLDDWPSAGLPLAKPLDEFRRDAPVASAAGTWRHAVDFANPVVIELRDDHAIHRDGPRGTWRQDGPVLTLRWNDDRAPGGAWIDRVVLEPGTASYTGHNQHGQSITATRP